MEPAKSSLAHFVMDFEFLDGSLVFFAFFHCDALWVFVALSGGLWGLEEGDERKCEGYGCLLWEKKGWVCCVGVGSSMGSGLLLCVWVW